MIVFSCVCLTKHSFWVERCNAVQHVALAHSLFTDPVLQVSCIGLHPAMRYYLGIQYQFSIQLFSLLIVWVQIVSNSFLKKNRESCKYSDKIILSVFCLNSTETIKKKNADQFTVSQLMNDYISMELKKVLKLNTMSCAEV